MNYETRLSKNTDLIMYAFWILILTDLIIMEMGENVPNL